MVRRATTNGERLVLWVGSSTSDVLAFPAQTDIDLVRERLKRARLDFESNPTPNQR